MVLADTSVWIDHFRYKNDRLAELLEADQVVMHPFVLGELACGNLNNRIDVLVKLKTLLTPRTVIDREVLYFIERRQLMGRGVGYIDIHLLAFSALIQSVRLWTLDKKLEKVSIELDLAYSFGE